MEGLLEESIARATQNILGQAVDEVPIQITHVLV